jgi:CRISPR/Cas system CSM-associated protein Csm3 (group 7 of RAMP superfamily)
MPQSEVAIDYHLTMRSATSFGPDSMPGAAWRASRLATNGSAHLPSIPGSAIKGRLRWTVEALTPFLGVPPCAGPVACQLNASCSVCGIFGNAHFESPFVFANAVLPAEIAELAFSLPKNERRVRGRADATARDAMPTGLVFTGTIRGWLAVVSNPEETELSMPAPLLLLLAAFGALDGIGGGRSVGLGSASFEIDGIAIGGLRLTGAQALAQLDRLEGSGV